MNRTPRSASRRASRQLAANVPGVRLSGPYSSNVDSGSRRQIGHVGHARLHAERHLVLRDPRFDLGIELLLELMAVQRVQLVEHRAAAGAADAVGVAEVEHRILAGPELHALILRIQKAAAPQPRVERLVGLVRRDEHDERRQVVVHRAQAVRQPRAHRRPAGDLRAGLKERDRRVVVDRLGEHRLDEADVVDDLAMMRQQLAEPRARLAVLGEFEERAGERDRRLLGRHAGEPLAAADVFGQLLAVLLVEQRLVVEQILLGRAAGLEQVDDALHARREVQAATTAAGVAARACSDSPSSEPSATPPIPAADVPKKWRRVTATSRSN